MRTFAAIGFATLLAFATRASADPLVTANYGGTVLSGTDGGDLFGGGNIAGETFSARFVFDPTFADLQPGAFVGGTNSFLPPDVVSVSLNIGTETFNGSTSDFSAGGVQQNVVVVSAPPGSFLIEFLADSAVSGSAGFINIGMSSDRFNGTLLSTSPIYSGISNGLVCLPCGYFSLAGGTTTGHLDVTSFDVNYPVSFILSPEPATWAMMLMGIGGVGGAVRRLRPVNSLGQTSPT